MIGWFEQLYTRSQFNLSERPHRDRNGKGVKMQPSLGGFRIGIRTPERGRITAFRVPYIGIPVAEVVEAVDGGEGTLRMKTR
jgi:hypothetical protein